MIFLIKFHGDIWLRFVENHSKYRIPFCISKCCYHRSPHCFYWNGADRSRVWVWQNATDPPTLPKQLQLNKPGKSNCSLTSNLLQTLGCDAKCTHNLSTICFCLGAQSRMQTPTTMPECPLCLCGLAICHTPLSQWRDSAEKTAQTLCLSLIHLYLVNLELQDVEDSYRGHSLWICLSHPWEFMIVEWFASFREGISRFPLMTRCKLSLTVHAQESQQS